MNNFTVVRTEHLNHHGFLFGGFMLKWVDEMAWITAARDFPNCTLVTIGMSSVAFKYRCGCGSILRFRIVPTKKGTTSVTYDVDVYADEPGATEEKHILETQVTFVRVSENGDKLALPDSNIEDLCSNQVINRCNGCSQRNIKF